MGPQAGIRLVDQVTKLTPAKRDQDHASVVLLSLPSGIGDRTDYILGRSAVNPGIAIHECVRMLRSIGASAIGIPCNTAHAPEIWSEIARRTNDEGESDVLVNMIEETARAIAADSQEGEKIGVLGTTGTIESDLYGHALRSVGRDTLYLHRLHQEAVQQSIYSLDHGIKATPNPTPFAREVLRAAVESMANAGAKHVILGCTELPLAVGPDHSWPATLWDPSEILAKVLIARVGLDPHPGHQQS